MNGKLQWRNECIAATFKLNPQLLKRAINHAILRENAAAQACAMELKTFGDVKFTADEYKEARMRRMELEAI